MARTTLLLDDERTTPQVIQDISELTTPRGSMTLGMLRFAAPPPTTDMADADASAWPEALEWPGETIARRRRIYLSSRCYDISIALLFLLSATVALYRLIWMGQP